MKSKTKWIIAWSIFGFGLVLLLVSRPLTRYILEQREGSWYQEFEPGAEHRIGSDSCFVAVPTPHGSYFASYNRPGLPEYFDTSHACFYEIDRPELWALVIARANMVTSTPWPALPDACVEAMKQFAASSRNEEAKILAEGIAAESGERVIVASAKDYIFISHGLLDGEELLQMAASLRCE